MGKFSPTTYAKKVWWHHTVKVKMVMMTFSRKILSLFYRFMINWGQVIWSQTHFWVARVHLWCATIFIICHGKGFNIKNEISSADHQLLFSTEAPLSDPKNDSKNYVKKQHWELQREEWIKIRSFLRFYLSPWFWTIQNLEERWLKDWRLHVLRKKVVLEETGSGMF